MFGNRFRGMVKLKGRGAFTFREDNGSTEQFVGEFEAGTAKGFGIYRMSNNGVENALVVSACWTDGVPDGHAVMRYANGDCRAMTSDTDCQRSLLPLSISIHSQFRALGR